MNKPEGTPRWALIDLLLWTVLVLVLLVEAVSLVGHWIFKIW